MLIGLGFSPLAASGLSLIANTAPVAYGALGTPVIALSAVTGLDLLELSGMIGRQLPFFSVIVPFWLIWAFVGFRGMMQVWPALLVAGARFRGAAVSGLQLPRPLAGRRRRRHRLDGLPRRASCGAGSRRSSGCPTSRTEDPRTDNAPPAAGPRLCRAAAAPRSRGQVFKAWVPWIILSVFVFIWGVPQIKAFLDGIWICQPARSPGLHNLVMKVPPVVAEPHAGGGDLQPNLLSATGTGILLAAIVAGFVLGYSPLGAWCGCTAGPST